MVRPRKDQNQAVQVPRGQPQGERKKLVQAQQAMPLPDQDAQMSQAVDVAQQMASPSLLTQPSARPNEPLTTGLAMGPGAGPEAVSPTIRPMQQDLSGIAAYLPMLEALADQSDSTAATRNFVRRLRGSLPPEVTMQSMVGKMAGGGAAP